MLIILRYLRILCILERRAGNEGFDEGGRVTADGVAEGGYASGFEVGAAGEVGSLFSGLLGKDIRIVSLLLSARGWL